MRLVTASSFGSFLKLNWLEILTLTLPLIRVLRVFRSIIALRGLKGFTRDRLHATGVYISFLLPFVWYSGAVAVLDAESRNPEASISNLKEALWWSLTTITTVGYGDKYPTTFEGQLVAAALMLTGIALFSAAAGMFASWITRGNPTQQK
jgi:voltage-gated potassium channel